MFFYGLDAEENSHMDSKQAKSPIELILSTSTIPLTDSTLLVAV